ncbi:MAG: cupin domain-containing protein, partial [Candidatus Binatia bacterium]
MAKAPKSQRYMWSKVFTYDEWMESLGLPIHKGFYIEDVRTLELEWWEERQCKAAFIQLMGQEGVSSARVTEIPPGKTLPPIKFALDELVYVADGRGITTVWQAEGRPKKTFEWQGHSLFLIPHNYYHQMSNMQGDKPVRLLHYSYMPLAMSAIQESAFFFNNPYQSPDYLDGQDGEFYSEAKLVQPTSGGDPFLGLRAFWYGNFFPDMRAWDKLDANVK